MKTCNILAKIDDSFRYLKALGIVWMNGKCMRLDVRNRIKRGMYAVEAEYVTTELYFVAKELMYAYDNDFITNGVSAKFAKKVLRREFNKNCKYLNKLEDTGLVDDLLNWIEEDDIEF